MAVLIIDMSIERDGRMTWAIDGKTTPPGGALVRPGDTVRWRSKDGDLIVRFTSMEPFGSQQFEAAAGELTEPPAVVQAIAPQRFECAVTLKGRTVSTAGVDVQPPP